jgi:glycopeptide antibiotics resistance protein
MKTKIEFSKVLILSLIIYCAVLIVFSYLLAWHGKANVNETVTVALITTIMGACIGYLIYQFKLKDSRNKYKIDENGVPFVDENDNGIPDDEEENT